MSIHKRRTKKGVVYDVRWREGQKNKGRTFPDRKDAVTFEAEQQRRLRLGAHAPSEPSSMPLSNFIEHWLLTSGVTWSASTRRTRAAILDKWIDPFLGHVPLRDIGRSRVREFRAEILRAGSPPVNTNNTMRILSSALGRAADEGLLPGNPCNRIGEVPTEEAQRRAFGAEVFLAMMQACKTPQDQSLIALGYWAGLRPAELVRATWGDVGGESLAVVGSVQDGEESATKTGRRRVVPIEPELRSVLDGTRPAGVIRTDPIRPASRGGYLDWHNWTTRVWNKARRTLGTDIIPMEMRHSCASRWLNEGWDVVTVAAWMGHDVQVLSAHYAHFMPRAPGRGARSAPSAHA
jgi:integrase